jgi:hypothetical protein
LDVPIGPIRHGDDLALTGRGQPAYAIERAATKTVMIESVSDVLSTRVSVALRYDRRLHPHPHDGRVINSIAKTSPAGD